VRTGAPPKGSSARRTRAFLKLARRPSRDDQRDAITRAYFRGLDAKHLPQQRRPEPPKPAKALNELAGLLRDAEVIVPSPAAPLAALTDGAPARPHLVAPVFEQAMSDLRQRDPELFSARMQELAYLVNVWIAGAAGEHDARRPRPVEALETVLRTCEAGMRATLATDRITPEEALAALRRTPADTLFRRGFRDTAGAEGG
jgi:hypothetical protein